MPDKKLKENHGYYHVPKDLRDDIAKQIMDARYLDKLSAERLAQGLSYQELEKGYPQFGEIPFTEEEEGLILDEVYKALEIKKIDHDSGKVAIFEHGVGVGLRWDFFLEKHPELKDKIEIYALNVSRHGFQSKVVKMRIGSLLGMSVRKYEREYESKFDLVFDFVGAEFYTLLHPSLYSRQTSINRRFRGLRKKRAVVYRIIGFLV